MRNKFKNRLKLLSTAVIIFVLLLVTRLYFLQVAYGDEYEQRAEEQYVKQTPVFDRGSIYFQYKDGEQIAVATLSGANTLYINPGTISDPGNVYEKLHQITGDKIEKEAFFESAHLKTDPYEEVVHGLTNKEAQAVKELNLKGVGLTEKYWRFYPGSESAAQAIGFVGFNGDAREGRYGLERYYDQILSRNKNQVKIDSFAQVFTRLEGLTGGASEDEGDLVLTIEPSVQLELEKILDDIRERWGSDMVAGIVMDPNTGEILGMAEKPSFDLNAYNEVDDISIFSNSLVERVYEMGSIMKPITMASGLDSGAVTPTTTYNDKGRITLNTKTISNYDGKARGVVPMQEVLNQSLNTGAAHIALQMGSGKFLSYIKRFGFDKRSGIDLPNEATGLIDNLNSGRDVEIATASFGQGIAVTPISMVRALSVLANGGYLVRPHLVKEINFVNGKKEQISNEQGGRAIKSKTSEDISRMLVNVVDDALLGGTVALENHSVAAKTGTAQIVNRIGGGYYDDRYLHTFFGYFPAFDPEFMVFFMNMDPRGARYASETLTAPFFDLTQFLIQYYEVAPDR